MDGMMGGACCTKAKLESALRFGNPEGKRPL